MGAGTSLISTNVRRLIGDRLRLRPTERADSDLLNRWADNADGARWFTYCLPRPIEALKQRFDETLHNDHDERFIVRLNDGRDIGIVGIHRSGEQNGEIDIAILDDTARGYGYGKESLCLIVNAAFLMYPLERLQCVVDARNESALKFFLKCGFLQEGRLRRVAFRDGNWCDTVILSMLRSEWNTWEHRSAK